ncbi:MAG TPA: hypothetical protein VJT49_14675 [Amycolatopsis sp.]|uniref:hypothetical protein n=1 Tax=Amycolatopsis sp. TaxID=37632 RepID=UPI002B48D837|nr:hypothetical protein [Amycolatopsis sp.]HKS46324.1 hypothetical protein [Amycolatopsis sp.]
MFMQFIQAKVRDPEAVRETMDRWHRELEPGAVGWLGGTYGITDDGTLVAAVRFESEEAARRNSQRPEQARWWEEMTRHLTGETTFHDCRDVTLLLGGGSDEAGFVQIIQGHVRDRARARALAEQSTDVISRYRPDIMGATIAIDDDGFLTETVAFTTEAAAREAERQDLPPEAARIVDEEMSLFDDVTYLDLHRPWFRSHE